VPPVAFVAELVAEVAEVALVVVTGDELVVVTPELEVVLV